MLRPFAKMGFICLVVFTTLSVSARVLGTTQPGSPLLAGFARGCEGKPRLCWYGIVPGVTTVDEAQRILLAENFVLAQPGIEEAGYKSFTPSDPAQACEFELYFQGSAIEEMALSTCEKIKLGDLTDALGVPHLITGLGIVMFEAEGLWVELPFADKTQCWNLNPSSTVSMIRLVPRETIDSSYRFFQREPKADWRGLLPFTGYMRLYGLKCRVF